MSETPANVLATFNFKADDPVAQATFWSRLLGGTITSQHEDHVFVAAREPEGIAMSFRARGPEQPGHQAEHLDLTVPWGTRTAEVERAVALGARHECDVLDEVPWVQWSTLRDPEGNLFSFAEHPPQQ